MEEEGTVSVWLGQAPSAATFWSALQATFSEDGDFIGSDFSRAFGIDYYDDALREAEFFDSPRSTIDQIVVGASYEEALLPRLEMLNASISSETNCMILLYNYRHDGPHVMRFSGMVITFHAAVSCNE